MCILGISSGFKCQVEEWIGAYVGLGSEAGMDVNLGVL